MENATPRLMLENSRQDALRAAAPLWGALGVGYRALWPLPALVAGYFLISRIVWLLAPFHISYSVGAAFLSALFFPACYLVLFVFRRIWFYLRTKNPNSPLRLLWSDLKRIVANRASLLNFAIVYPALVLFMYTFTEMKGNIPILNPYSWDATFAGADRALFGGHDPWRLLAPLFGNPWMTFLINFVYNFWFFLFLGSLISVALSRQASGAGVRYLLAFVLTWSVGGSLLATVFSSAGPAFYDKLGIAPNPYAGLMSQLRAFNETLPVWALEKQEALWNLYEMKDAVLGGMSAFPSMHNAQAVLMALFAWRLGARWGWAATGFALCVFLGSIWLGWHYAADAWAGVLLALAVWWACGPLAEWIMSRPAMRRYQALLRRLDSRHQRKYAAE